MTLINREFLELHKACPDGREWWLQNGLDFLHTEDLDQKVTGDYNGYIHWLRNLPILSYNENRLVCLLTYSNGFSVIKEYDGCDKLICITHSDGCKWTYTYNDRGDKISEQYPDGDMVVIKYDSNNRKSRLIYTPPVDKVLRGNYVIKYAYDSRGNLITINHSLDGITTNTYNSLNQIISTRNHNNVTIGYTYDPNNNILSKRFDNGKVVEWRYYNSNKEFKVSLNGDIILTIQK